MKIDRTERRRNGRGKEDVASEREGMREDQPERREKIEKKTK